MSHSGVAVAVIAVFIQFIQQPDGGFAQGGEVVVCHTIPCARSMARAKNTRCS